MTVPLRKPAPTQQQSEAARAAALIGQHVYLEAEDGSLAIECRVMDIKQVFGRTCVLVSPTSGSGSTWVNLPRISPIAKEKK